MGNAFNLAHSFAFIQSLKCLTATVYILPVSGVKCLTRANLTRRPRSLNIQYTRRTVPGRPVVVFTRTPRCDGSYWPGSTGGQLMPHIHRYGCVSLGGFL